MREARKLDGLGHRAVPRGNLDGDEREGVVLGDQDGQAVRAGVLQDAGRGEGRGGGREERGHAGGQGQRSEGHAVGVARDRRATKGIVYFVQAGAGGPIKIGVTADVQQRLRTLQTASPSDLHVLGTRPGGAALEQDLHQRFAAYRLRGEWFRPEAELLAYIGEDPILGPISMNVRAYAAYALERFGGSGVDYPELRGRVDALRAADEEHRAAGLDGRPDMWAVLDRLFPETALEEA